MKGYWVLVLLYLSDHSALSLEARSKTIDQEILSQPSKYRTPFLMIVNKLIFESTKKRIFYTKNK